MLTGFAAVEKVYSRSSSLNGDAVVIFMRALCAISQEELVPALPGEAVRCCSIQLGFSMISTLSAERSFCSANNSYRQCHRNDAVCTDAQIKIYVPRSLAGSSYVPCSAATLAGFIPCADWQNVHMAIWAASGWYRAAYGPWWHRNW